MLRASRAFNCGKHLTEKRVHPRRRRGKVYRLPSWRAMPQYFEGQDDDDDRVVSTPSRIASFRCSAERQPVNRRKEKTKNDTGAPRLLLSRDYRVSVS